MSSPLISLPFTSSRLGKVFLRPKNYVREAFDINNNKLCITTVTSRMSLLADWLVTAECTRVGSVGLWHCWCVVVSTVGTAQDIWSVETFYSASLPLLRRYASCFIISVAIKNTTFLCSTTAGEWIDTQ